MSRWSWPGSATICAPATAASGPAVTTRERRRPVEAVDGLGRRPRRRAMLVSTHDGGAAYGGTPSDRSVIEAIAEIKARGLKVTLYPFVMMDVPAGNALPDPYGGDGAAGLSLARAHHLRSGAGAAGHRRQDGGGARRRSRRSAATADAGRFSRRGRHDRLRRRRRRLGLPPLRPALCAAGGGGGRRRRLPDRLGTARPDDAARRGRRVSLRRAAVRPGRRRARDPRAGDEDHLWRRLERIFRPPAGGRLAATCFFHLDPLWAHAAIDAVGIDNYMPLSDWRDGDYAGGNPDGVRRALRSGRPARGDRRRRGLRLVLCRASPTARRASARRSPTAPTASPGSSATRICGAGGRTRISTGIGGVEAATPTAWVPRSKPIWFTELGCPAVDKGPNQPNVFPDPKSAESALPYFSSGGRADLAQQRFLEAHAAHWDPASAEVSTPATTRSRRVYGGRMVDAARIYVWAWDARPFPAFPLRADVWARRRQLALRPLAERPARQRRRRRSDQRDPRRSRPAGRRCRRRRRHRAGLCRRRAGVGARGARAAGRPVRPGRAARRPDGLAFRGEGVGVGRRSTVERTGVGRRRPR